MEDTLPQEPTLRDVMRELQIQGNDIRQVKEHLTGNGKPETGLNHRVPVLESRVEGLEEAHKGVTKWVIGLVTAAGISLVGFVWNKSIEKHDSKEGQASVDRR